MNNRLLLRRMQDVAPNPLQTATSAFSLVDLGLTSGNIVTVRRSSDNATQNFTTAEITNGTLTTFVGVGNDGRVERMTDHQGNYDVFNLVTTIQPLIVENGNLIIENGLPALKFQNDSYLENDTLLDLPDLTIVTVNRSISNSNASRAFGIRSTSTTNRNTFAQASDNSLRYDGASSSGSIAPNNALKIRFSAKQVEQVYDFLNLDENINQTNVLLNNANGFINLGGPQATLNQRFEGVILAAFIWETNKLNDRLEITNYINSLFNVY